MSIGSDDTLTISTFPFACYLTRWFLALVCCTDTSLTISVWGLFANLSGRAYPLTFATVWFVLDTVALLFSCGGVFGAYLVLPTCYFTATTGKAEHLVFTIAVGAQRSLQALCSVGQPVEVLTLPTSLLTCGIVRQTILTCAGILALYLSTHPLFIALLVAALLALKPSRLV